METTTMGLYRVHSHPKLFYIGVWTPDMQELSNERPGLRGPINGGGPNIRPNI